MTKRELVKWLEKEKTEAVKKAKEESSKAIKELKEHYYEELGVNNLIAKVIPLFTDAFKEYKEFYDKIGDIEHTSISKFGYRRGYYDIEALTEEYRLRESLIDAIFFSSEHECTKKEKELNTECKKVENTYDTVIQTVKNLPTYKDGIEYLKALGFNTAEIVPLEQKKMLPATISVNVDIKYLLLNKNKGEENEIS